MLLAENPMSQKRDMGHPDFRARGRNRRSLDYAWDDKSLYLLDR
jgi:hypothetical protein